MNDKPPELDNGELPVAEFNAKGSYGDLVDQEIANRARLDGANLTKLVWTNLMADGGKLYESIVENGPLLPEGIVERIGAGRIQTAAEVLLQIDILSVGEWSEIEALRTCHAGLLVLLTLAEVARERQEEIDGNH